MNFMKRRTLNVITVAPKLWQLFHLGFEMGPKCWSSKKFFNLIFFLYLCQFLAYSLILPDDGISNYIDNNNGFNNTFGQIPFLILNEKKEGSSDFWKNAKYETSENDYIQHKMDNNFDFEKTFKATDEGNEAYDFIVVSTTDKKTSAAEEDSQQDENALTNLFLQLDSSRREMENREESKSEREREKRQVVRRRRRRRRLRRPCKCNGKKTKVIRKRNRGERRRRRRIIKCICKKKKQPEEPEPPPTTAPSPPEGEGEGEYIEYQYLDGIDSDDFGEEEEPAEEQTAPPAPAPAPAPSPPPTVIVAPTQQQPIYISPQQPLFGYGYGRPPYAVIPAQYPGLSYGNRPYYGVPAGNIPVYSYPILFTT